MKYLLGVLTLLGGLVLLYVRHRGGDQVPRWIARLALALTSLGISTLLSTQSGVAWSIASICFSVVAIAILSTVLWELVTRR
jgi:hypothetical protein